MPKQRIQYFLSLAQVLVGRIGCGDSKLQPVSGAVDNDQWHSAPATKLRCQIVTASAKRRARAHDTGTVSGERHEPLLVQPVLVEDLLNEREQIG